MSDLNPFAKRLVDMVREMPDDLLLELVRDHLASTGDANLSPARGPAKSAPKRGRAARKGGRGKKSRSSLEAEVLDVVNRGDGLALADVAAAVGASKPRTSAALRALKASGAIHAAGDRRFTRYGKTKAIATAASKKARKG